MMTNHLTQACFVAGVALAACWPAWAMAQEDANLIPNPSFEYFDSAPKEIGQLHLARPWQSVAQQGDQPADFFAAGAKPRVDVPANFNGTEPARTGSAYAGLIPFSRMDDGQYREFLIAPLKEPLQAGCTYRAGCFVSRAERSKWAVDGIQLLFVPRLPLLAQGGYAQYLPQVKAADILRESTGWTEVSGTFRARGGEKLLLIGNFQSSDDTGQRRLIAKGKDKEGGDIAYYYLDDVSCEKVMEADGSPARVATPPPAPAVAATMVTAVPGVPTRLDNVYFASDQATLLPQSAVSLDQLAALLTANSAWTALLGGHTDNTNTPNHNLLLSQNRAEAVRQYLIGKGIAPARLKAQGYGDTQPVADNATPEGRERNRRVEFTVKDTGEPRKP